MAILVRLSFESLTNLRQVPNKENDRCSCWTASSKSMSSIANSTIPSLFQSHLIIPEAHLNPAQSQYHNQSLIYLSNPPATPHLVAPLLKVCQISQSCRSESCRPSTQSAHSPPKCPRPLGKLVVLPAPVLCLCYCQKERSIPNNVPSLQSELQMLLPWLARGPLLARA